MTAPDTSPTDSGKLMPKPDPNERDVEAHRFGLHPLVASLVGLYFFLIIGGTVFVAIWRDKMDLFDGLFVSVVVSAFLIGVPSWIVWRITRSRLAGNITCTVLVGLMISFFFVGIYSTSSVAKKNAAWKTFDEQSKELSSSDLLERLIDGEDVTMEAADKLSKYIDATDSLAEDTSDEGKAIVAFGAAMRPIQVKVEAYAIATAAYMESGGVVPTDLNTIEDIQIRKGILDNAIITTRELSDAYAGLIDTFESEAQARGIDRDFRNSYVRKIRYSAAPDLIADIKATELRIWDIQVNILGMYEERLGEWNYDVEDEWVEFSRPEDNKRYDQLLTQWDEADADGVVLKKELQARFNPNMN